MLTEAGPAPPTVSHLAIQPPPSALSKDSITSIPAATSVSWSEAREISVQAGKIPACVGTLNRRVGTSPRCQACYLSWFRSIGSQVVILTTMVFDHTEWSLKPIRCIPFASFDPHRPVSDNRAVSYALRGTRCRRHDACCRSSLTLRAWDQP